MEASDYSCKVFIVGQDVTDFIRTPQVNNAVSIVASYKGVRQYLVERQRLMAEVLVALYWMDVILVPLYYLMRN